MFKKNFLCYYVDVLRYWRNNK